VARCKVAKPQMKLELLHNEAKSLASDFFLLILPDHVEELASKKPRCARE